MEPFVRSDINAHIDSFIENGACDIVAELAEPVPAETICRLVGIDDALVPAVRKAAIEMFAAQGSPDEFGRKQAAFAAVTVTEIHDRRRLLLSAEPCGHIRGGRSRNMNRSVARRI
jgi:cytochrome P450